MAVFKFRNLKNGQATPIPTGEFIVGRADDAYVHVEDASVSRRHARIINQANGFFLEDLGSSNGTEMRGALITERMGINYGDEIYIGSVPFRVDPEVAGEPVAAPSAGLRVVNRAYMRRDTERLPSTGTLSRVAEQPLPEKSSAAETRAAMGASPAWAEEKSQAVLSVETAETAPKESTTSWNWLFLGFWAGMGVGLLLGLFFARVFMEMGGKAASLP